MVQFFRSRIAPVLLLGLVYLSTVAPVLASTCSAKSGEHRVTLLELYTSEGCDSCPPTDEWVSKLPARGLTRDQLIPLAFHVDYWNYLGWRDVFSQAKFSERQRQMAQINHSFVYTPQLILNGRDYRPGFRNDDTSNKVNEINNQKSLADITLTWTMPGPERLHVSGKIRVASDMDRRNAQVYLALYENNLSTAVKAGENSGRTLHHDSVVRELVGPIAFDGEGYAQVEQDFILQHSWKRQDTGVVAFVQNVRSGEVLQALALAACN